LEDFYLNHIVDLQARDVGAIDHSVEAVLQGRSSPVSPSSGCLDMDAVKRRSLMCLSNPSSFAHSWNGALNPFSGQHSGRLAAADLGAKAEMESNEANIQPSHHGDLVSKLSITGQPIHI
jgi:hypothetical protein